MNYENPELIFDHIPSGKIGWSSPSNIALVKYWGKKGIQIPMNASLSFTLGKSLTETIVEFAPKKGDNQSIDFYFDGIPNPKFASKTSEFFQRVISIFPFLQQLDFTIFSKNTFPHSTGIASSASGMSALALILCDIENQYFNTFSNREEFYQKASFVARLGSGSACRSVYEGATIWGEISGINQSSDLFASKLPFEMHEVFSSYKDSIVIVDGSEKKVSSTAGHGLMKNNPFGKARIEQANSNLTKLIHALQSGDIDNFIKIVENEALTLHAMMQTSDPAFILIKPNTLSIIEKLWEYREKTGVPLCFTLDAGPNLHILYPDESRSKVQEFIESILDFTTGQVINDFVGKGPEKLEI